MGSRSKGDTRGRPQPICRPRQSPSSPIAIAGPGSAPYLVWSTSLLCSFPANFDHNRFLILICITLPIYTLLCLCVFVRSSYLMCLFNSCTQFVLTTALSKLLSRLLWFPEYFCAFLLVRFSFFWCFCFLPLFWILCWSVLCATCLVLFPFSFHK